MLVFSKEDRDSKAPKGFQNFYTFPAITLHSNERVFKIGSNSQTSFTGRCAWNEFCNDGYHKFNLRGKLFDDEKDRIKITEAVYIPKIFDEVLIKTTKKGITNLEEELRSHLRAYKFPEKINFSGKTEFVYADSNTYIVIEEFFKYLRKNYECK